MLHTKFQGHQSIGSGEEDFLRFLPYMGMVAMLVMCPTHLYKFSFPTPLSFHMSFGFKWPNCFCEKQVLTLKSE